MQLKITFFRLCGHVFLQNFKIGKAAVSKKLNSH